MNQKIIIITISALLIGGFTGYVIASPNSMKHSDLPSDAHMMADGTIMSDSMDMSKMSMEEMMIAMNSDLAIKTGEDFEVAFLEGMIQHHVGAVDMAELVLEKTDREELISLANEIIEAQTTEIEMMNEWLKTWY